MSFDGFGHALCTLYLRPLWQEWHLVLTQKKHKLVIVHFAGETEQMPLVQEWLPTKQDARRG